MQGNDWVGKDLVVMAKESPSAGGKGPSGISLPLVPVMPVLLREVLV
jgi:hypothetical protein